MGTIRNMTDIEFCYLLIGVITVVGFFLIRSEFKRDNQSVKNCREYFKKQRDAHGGHEVFD